MSTVMPDATDTLAAERRQAIEESGWGERFRFVQPHNLAFWVYLLLVVFGSVVVVRQWGVPGVKAYDQVFVVAIAVYALYTVPFWLFLRHHDRFTAVPPKLAATGLVYGGLAATGAMALSANESVRPLWSKVTSQAFAYDWSAALTAPFTEELAKGSGLILLIALAPRLIRSPFDGLILGAFLGLGFQVVEDIAYATNGAGSAFGADQLASSQTTIVLRMVVGIASHWVYSGIFCAGVVYLLGRPNFPARRAHGLLLMGLAMFCHGVWDGVAAITKGNVAWVFPLQFGIAIFLLLIFGAVYRSTVKTERNWMRELMAPEVALGVITPDELDALAGSREERKHFVKTTKGHHSHVVAKHVIEAATDLAHQIARDGGQDTPQVMHARAEVARLRAS